MQSFLRKIQQALSSWMQGRYGTDELSMFLLISAIVLMLAGSLFDTSVLSTLALLISVLALFRSCSKNHSKRLGELQIFQKVVKKPKAWLSLTSKRITNRKTTCYFKCEECQTTLSVPKGKGEIRVTCPKCKTVKNYKT